MREIIRMLQVKTNNFFSIANRNQLGWPFLSNVYYSVDGKLIRIDDS